MPTVVSEAASGKDWSSVSGVTDATTWTWANDFQVPSRRGMLGSRSTSSTFFPGSVVRLFEPSKSEAPEASSSFTVKDRMAFACLGLLTMSFRNGFQWSLGFDSAFARCSAFGSRRSSARSTTNSPRLRPNVAAPSVTLATSSNGAGSARAVPDEARSRATTATVSCLGVSMVWAPEGRGSS